MALVAVDVGNVEAIGLSLSSMSMATLTTSFTLPSLKTLVKQEEKSLFQILLVLPSHLLLSFPRPLKPFLHPFLLFLSSPSAPSLLPLHRRKLLELLLFASNAGASASSSASQFGAPGSSLGASSSLGAAHVKTPANM